MTTHRPMEEVIARVRDCLGSEDGWEELEAEDLVALCDAAEALEAAQAENRTLRGLVQTNPGWKCPYGMNDKPSMGFCPSGFPGCACADDRLSILCEDEERIFDALRTRAEAAEAQFEFLAGEIRAGARLVAALRTRAEAAEEVVTKQAELGAMLTSNLNAEIKALRTERAALQAVLQHEQQAANDTHRRLTEEILRANDRALEQSQRRAQAEDARDALQAEKAADRTAIHDLRGKLQELTLRCEGLQGEQDGLKWRLQGAIGANRALNDERDGLVQRVEELERILANIEREWSRTTSHRIAIRQQDLDAVVAALAARSTPTAEATAAQQFESGAGRTVSDVADTRPGTDGSKAGLLVGDDGSKSSGPAPDSPLAAEREE